MGAWALTTDRGISPHPEGFNNIRGFAQKARKKIGLGLTGYIKLIV